MRTVALDLGVRRIDFCEVSKGTVTTRGSVRSVRELGRGVLGPNTPPAQVAFEACREGWHVAGELERWGHTPVMVDTTRVKQLGIGLHGRKTDRIDAETLAVALAAGRIPQAHILSPHRQELRLQLSVRRMLVESRAQYVTAIRGLARARGNRLEACGTEAFPRRLATASLDERTRLLIAPLREPLEALQRRLGEVDLKLEQLCQAEPDITRLMTAPGVGMIVAAAFVSVIDEARRFRKAHELESYLGLVPREESTGGRRRIGAISKAGNTYLRSLLVEAAWSLLRSKGDDPLRQWGRQLVRRRGQRIAVVALARRLAGILWAMWRDQAVYDPERVGRATAAGLSREAVRMELTAVAFRRVAEKLAWRKRSARRAIVVSQTGR
jgi:transposase